MSESTVDRDERTIAVENAGYRWAYIFLTYGLLVFVICRSLAFRESNWDLMALVIVGGAVTTVYQAAHKVLSRHGAWIAIAAMLLGAAVAAITVGIVHFIK
jgi:hypothetical protein